MVRSASRASFLAGFALLTLVGAALAASAPVPLSGAVPGGQFSITPDGLRIVFESYNGSNSLLYSARTDGVGSPIPISPGTGPSYLFNGKFTPDSSIYVFNTYETPADGLHVATYSNRLDGTGTPVPVNSSKVYDDDTSQYNLAVSPDSQRVVIRADQGDYSFDLLSRRVDGSGAVVTLNEGSQHGDGSFGDGVRYNWTAAGNNVVFSALAVGSEERNLYSRVFDGSLPAVQLSPGGKTFLDYAVSGDATKVAMTASGAGGRALYSRGTGGGPLTVLTPEDDNPNAFQGLYIDPQGLHVLFFTNYHLSTVPADGSAAPKALTPNPDGEEGFVVISPNGQQVAFISRPSNSAQQELYVSPIDASLLPKKLNAPLPAGGNIEFMVFSPDSQHIVYLGDQLTDGVEELFSVPADGSSGPVRLATSTNFRITPDGRNVIYAGATPAGVSALYLIGIEGGQPVLVAENPYGTGAILPFGDGWQITPDGAKVIFTADDGASRVGIFAVAIPEPGSLAITVSAGAVLLLRARRRHISLQ